MNESEYDRALEEIETAFRAVVETLIESMLANGVSTPKAMGDSFTHQRDALTALEMHRAAHILDTLASFAGDPQRATTRKNLKRLLTEPPPTGPEGSQ
jgi:hypothetical protein